MKQPYSYTYCARMPQELMNEVNWKYILLQTCSYGRYDVVILCRMYNVKGSV